VKGFFRKNLSLKILALALAILLEAQFNNPKSVDLQLDITLRNLPISKMVLSPENAESGLSARAVVRGPGPLVEGLSATEQKVFIDVPPGNSNVFSVELRPEQLRLPRGVEVVGIEPSTFDFTLERVIRRQLPVVVNYEGEPAKGYSIKRLRPLPATVLARGPQSELRGKFEVETRPLDVTDVSSSKTFEVALQDIGRYTRLAVNFVSVEVEVIAIEQTRKFEKLSLKVLAPPGFAATVEPTRVDVEIAGREGVVKNLEPKMITLEADGRNLPEGRHQVAVSATLPNGVEVIRTVPEKVSVNLIARNGK